MALHTTGVLEEVPRHDPGGSGVLGNRRGIDGSPGPPPGLGEAPRGLGLTLPLVELPVLLGHGRASRALPCGSPGELPQPRRMTTGAKASLPSTQCLRMPSRMLGGKWMCRSQRKTMLLASWRPRSRGGLSTPLRSPSGVLPWWSGRALPALPTLPRTSTASTPACKPAERSKFPVRLKYWYLGEVGRRGEGAGGHRP